MRMFDLWVFLKEKNKTDFLIAKYGRESRDTDYSIWQESVKLKLAGEEN